MFELLVALASSFGRSWCKALGFLLDMLSHMWATGLALQG